MQIFNNIYQFWLILFISNILMYVLTIVISYFWSKYNNFNTLKLTKKDINNSLFTLLINVLVAIPGYLLFSNGYITFQIEFHFIRDIIVLYFFFDLTMYLLHLASHYVWPFQNFHKKHHSHKYFNAISLYVMEPIESLLFGLLLTIFVYFYSVNFYSFLVFIFINWLLGVIGHLNTNSTKQPLLFGNHIFHSMHHQYPNSNYGFYTLIWDRLFGTINKRK